MELCVGGSRICVTKTCTPSPSDLQPRHCCKYTDSSGAGIAGSASGNSLLGRLWDVSSSGEFLLSVQSNDIWTHFRVSERARSRIEWDVENVVTVGQLAFDSSPKTADLRNKCGKTRCRCLIFKCFYSAFSSGVFLSTPQEMPIFFATCAGVTHTSDVKVVRNLAKFLSFLDIAGRPAIELSDFYWFWIFFKSVVALVGTNCIYGD